MEKRSQMNSIQLEAFLILRYHYGIQEPTMRQVNYFLLYGRVIEDKGISR